MTLADASSLVYDPFSWTIQHNPYPTYERLREEAPVYFNPEREFWAISRYEDVLAASLDPHTFVSSQGVTIEGGERGQPLLIVKDPPEHDWHRKVVARVFSPKYVAGLEPFVREHAARMLDEFVGADGFDVVESFSVQLPLLVASYLLGIPEEHRQTIHHLSDRLVTRDEEGQATPDAEAARVELGVLMYNLVVDRRANPGDDVISLLVNTPVVDDEGNETFLDDVSLSYRFLELAFAGHETVARLIANGIVALTWFPDARRELLADPSLMPAAVDEMLRWDAPSHYQGRWTSRDVTLHGVTIPADQRVVLVTGAANHDPRAYEHPGLFSLHRPSGVRQLGFGFGVHLCLGANVARLETRVAFEEFLARFRDWEIEESGVVRMRSGNVRGLSHLPIRLR